MSTSTDPSATLRSLRRVRQVRQFDDQPVTAEALDAIADVGRWSGSSQNRQPWRFLVVRDVDLVRRIGSMDLPHSRALTTAMAAIVLVMPSDEAIARAYDEGRAAERMLIAASELGLAAGIMWVSAGGRAAVTEALGIPDGWMPHTMLAVGHAAPEALAPKNPPGKARRPRARMVAVDHWSDALAE